MSTPMPEAMEAAFKEAAERLDRQATLDTVMALVPWIKHWKGCSEAPCTCGLREVLDALRGAA